MLRSATQAIVNAKTFLQSIVDVEEKINRRILDLHRFRMMALLRPQSQKLLSSTAIIWMSQERAMKDNKVAKMTVPHATPTSGTILKFLAIMEWSQFVKSTMTTAMTTTNSIAVKEESVV